MSDLAPAGAPQPVSEVIASPTRVPRSHPDQKRREQEPDRKQQHKDEVELHETVEEPAVEESVVQPTDNSDDDAPPHPPIVHIDVQG